MVTLELKNVSLSYNHKPVVNEFSFKVAPGELVGMIGPNGCGKTSIIRALSRIIPVRTGQIFLEGKELTSIPRMVLARLLGVVPQSPVIPDSFTVFEVVLLGRNPHLGLLQKEGARDINITWRAMEQTSTAVLAERRIGELSGGEKQRVTIARVLAQEPGAILLDEPTANLDISHQAEIMDLIKRLCTEKKLAVLIALHDLNLAAQYCDRLILINNGQIHAEGTPDTVITSQNIKEVYGTESCVYPHPDNNLPVVLVNGNGKSGNKSENDKLNEKS